MYIYSFEYTSGEIDWIFAPTKREAIKFYKNHIGDSDLDGYTIKRLTKEECDDSYLLDCSELEPEEGDEGYEDYCEDDYMSGYKKQCSFTEYINENSITDFVATTEF